MWIAIAAIAGIIVGVLIGAAGGIWVMIDHILDSIWPNKW
jgi:uncharacterized protein YneF (UPF0154 family)